VCREQRPGRAAHPGTGYSERARIQDLSALHSHTTVILMHEKQFTPVIISCRNVRDFSPKKLRPQHMPGAFVTVFGKQRRLSI